MSGGGWVVTPAQLNATRLPSRNPSITRQCISLMCTKREQLVATICGGAATSIQMRIRITAIEIDSKCGVERIGTILLGSPLALEF